MKGEAFIPELTEGFGFA